MLDSLNQAQFSECLGSKFQLHLDSKAPLELELIESKILSAPSKQGNRKVRKEPFSLLFRCSEGTYLPQRIYKLEHATLGTLDLFIVPVARDEEGMYYEAIFT